MVGHTILNAYTELLSTTDILSLDYVCMSVIQATMHYFACFSDVSLALENLHSKSCAPSCCFDIEMEAHVSMTKGQA